MNCVPRGRGGPPASVLRCLSVTLAIGLAVVLAQPASASGTGAATAAINVGSRASRGAPPAVISITVSPSALTFGSCKGGGSNGSVLGFPNGTCSAPMVTVTNVGSTTKIGVMATDAIPTGGGTSWILCGSPVGPPCSGQLPGTDQLMLALRARGSTLLLAIASQCDTTIGPTCTLAAGKSAKQGLTLTGPSSTENTATVYTTVVTWIAIP